MRFGDVLRLVSGDLVRLRSRVVLTLAGVVIGTASVVLLVSLGAGIQRALGAAFSQAGFATRISVQARSRDAAEHGPREAAPASAAARAGLTRRAVADIKGVPGVAQVVGRVNVMASRMELGTQSASWATYGADPRELAEMFTLASGRFPASQRELVVGSKVPAALAEHDRPGEAPDLVGRTVRIYAPSDSPASQDVAGESSMRFRIVGVLAPSDPETDISVYMPLRVARTALPATSQTRFDEVIVKATSAKTVDDAAGRIDLLGYEATSLRETVAMINDSMSVVQVGLGCLGAVALLVSGLGIASTMSASVLERRRDIGVMMAVGASRGAIMRLFLAQSAIIGLMGGLGGLGASYALTGAGNMLIKTATGAAAASPLAVGLFYIPWQLAVFAIVFSALIGMVAGAAPASSASRVSPTTAMRGD